MKNATQVGVVSFFVYGLTKKQRIVFSSIDTVLANQSFGSESTEIYLENQGVYPIHCFRTDF